MNTEQEVKRLLERVKVFIPIHLDDCDLSLREQAVKKLYALVQAQQEELEALRRVAQLTASCWYYGDWKAETHNERELEKSMRALGLWPTTEDDVIARTIAQEKAG